MDNDSCIIKKLEMLDIPVDFENQVFHDFGNVDDIPGIISMLKNDSLEKRHEHSSARGHYFQGIKDNILHHIWLYQLDPNDIPQAVFIRGHEETHALHGSGNLHLLKPKLKLYGNTFDFSKIPNLKDCSYEESEIPADIGGIYSLVSRGLHYKMLKNYGDIHPKAVEVFEANQDQNTKIMDMNDLIELLGSKDEQ